MTKQPYTVCWAHLSRFSANESRAIPSMHHQGSGKQSCVFIGGTAFLAWLQLRTFRGSLIPAQTFLLYWLFSKAEGPRLHPLGKLPSPSTMNGVHCGLRVGTLAFKAISFSQWVWAAHSVAVTLAFGFLYFLSLCDTYSFFYKINITSKEESKNFNNITILELLSILHHQRKMWGFFPKRNTINFLIKNKVCLNIYFKTFSEWPGWC